MFKVSNPVLTARAFDRARDYTAAQTMTVQGVVNKTLMLTGLVLITAYFSWTNPQYIMLTMWGGLIGGFVLALVTSFNPGIANITGPIYAVAEGLFLGAISMMFEAKYPGIIQNTVLLTMGTTFGLLFAYKARWIRVTEKFRSGVISAMMGLMIFYLIAMVMGFFGMNVSFFHDASPLGILINVFALALAAASLLMDFDFIENASRAGYPKQMEWYAAFGIIVTLVWMYIEILKLLSRLQRR